LGLRGKSVDLEQLYRRNANFVYRKIENETILVPIKNNVGDMSCIYKLNEVGAFIWEHLDGEKTLNDILNMVAEEFDVSAEDAQIDLHDYVRDLNEIGAIHQ
jgi:methyltransferase-like protein